MTGTNEYDALQDYLAGLHGELFPEPFKTMSWSLLVAHVDSLTKQVNKALAFYHDESTSQEQEAMSPTLCYAQALLAALARLARFDEKDLTRFNQIVADTEAMLVDRAALIETRYREQAEYQRKLTRDEKLKGLMEKFLDSCRL
ncbi:MAG: hypothetical protein JW839_21290 [Candidatus Lokiarchaeota archaeon]|nr:hypothetical protein [Candidatus Lokiarchaeota archaeon]